MRLSSLTIDAVGKSAWRYRNLVGLATAVFAVAALFPGERDQLPHAGASIQAADPPAAPRTPASSGSGAQPAAPSSEPIATTFEAYPPMTTPSHEGTQEPAPVVPPVTGAAPPPAAAGPLRILEGGWAGREPVDPASVPAEDLPVAAQAGQVDKLSFIRLTGQGTTLVLSLDDQQRQITALASVRACPISDPDWSPVHGAPMSEAPAYDTTWCTAGTPDDEGKWVFDLEDFADRTGRAGFALVPVTDLTATFQLFFRRD